MHGYADVDDTQVVARLDDLHYIEAFVAAVTRWLMVQPAGEGEGG